MKEPREKDKVTVDVYSQVVFVCDDIIYCCEKWNTSWFQGIS